MRRIRINLNLINIFTHIRTNLNLINIFTHIRTQFKFNKYFYPHTHHLCHHEPYNATPHPYYTWVVSLSRFFDIYYILQTSINNYSYKQHK
jgi:hypothetical protein